MSLPREAITTASQQHARPANEHYTYGTSGFRMDAKRLDSVVFQVGLISALRSKCLRGRVIGAMVTASHNPEHVRRVTSGPI